MVFLYYNMEVTVAVTVRGFLCRIHVHCTCTTCTTVVYVDLVFRPCTCKYHVAPSYRLQQANFLFEKEYEGIQKLKISLSMR